MTTKKRAKEGTSLEGVGEKKMTGFLPGTLWLVCLSTELSGVLGTLNSSIYPVLKNKICFETANAVSFVFFFFFPS